MRPAKTKLAKVQSLTRVLLGIYHVNYTDRYVCMKAQNDRFLKAQFVRLQFCFLSRGETESVDELLVDLKATLEIYGKMANGYLAMRDAQSLSNHLASFTPNTVQLKIINYFVCRDYSLCYQSFDQRQHLTSLNLGFKIRLCNYLD